MPDELRIVRASAEHLDVLMPLFDGYRQFYKQPSDPSAGRTFLALRIERGESVIFLAQAREGDQFRGAGMAQLFPTFSSVSLSARWILNDLFVDPGFRRRGIGCALAERCMAHCRESGAGAGAGGGMMLLTENTNTSAQHLYQSLGWTRDETYWRYTWKPS